MTCIRHKMLTSGVLWRTNLEHQRTHPWHAAPGPANVCAQEPEGDGSEQQWAHAQFRPLLHDVIEDLHAGKLSEDEFPSVAQRAAPSEFRSSQPILLSVMPMSLLAQHSLHQPSGDSSQRWSYATPTHNT